MRPDAEEPIYIYICMYYVDVDIPVYQYIYNTR
jgi:hypothetical protein